MLIDWYDSFRPALLLLLSCRNPYSAHGFFSPPWILFPMIPFLWLPDILIVAIPVVVIFLSIWRYSRNWRMGLLFAISPPVVLGALGGASDWIPIMALSLPTPWAVLFLLAKPQVGLFTATYLAWKSKKVENLIPLTGLTVLSLLLYGPSPSVSYATNGSWNLARLWPWSAILSVPLVLYGLREQGFLPAATLFLSPYFQLSSLWTLILPIVKKGDKNE